ncbi:hypothetical protein [Streptomyces sp. JNUCC 63]
MNGGHGCRGAVSRPDWGWHDHRTTWARPGPRGAPHPADTFTEPRPPLLRTARESDLPELQRLDEDVFQEVAHPAFLLRRLSICTPVTCWFWTTTAGCAATS